MSGDESLSSLHVSVGNCSNDFGDHMRRDIDPHGLTASKPSPNIWRRRIPKAFDVAGTVEEPATPHRFRHTFARILLQRGVPVADVADLFGDDEKTVREHDALGARTAGEIDEDPEDAFQGNRNQR